MTRSASTAAAMAKMPAFGQRPRSCSIAGIAAAWLERISTITTSGVLACAACSSMRRADTAPDRSRRARPVTNSSSSLTISALSCAMSYPFPLVPLSRGSLGELSLIRRFRCPQPLGRRVDLLLPLLEQRSLTLGFLGQLLFLGFSLLGLFRGRLVGLGFFLGRQGVALGLFLRQLLELLAFFLLRLRGQLGIALGLLLIPLGLLAHHGVHALLLDRVLLHLDLGLLRGRDLHLRLRAALLLGQSLLLGGRTLLRLNLLGGSQGRAFARIERPARLRQSRRGPRHRIGLRPRLRTERRRQRRLRLLLGDRRHE